MLCGIKHQSKCTACEQQGTEFSDFRVLTHSLSTLSIRPIRQRGFMFSSMTLLNFILKTKVRLGRKQKPEGLFIRDKSLLDLLQCHAHWCINNKS